MSNDPFPFSVGDWVRGTSWIRRVYVIEDDYFGFDRYALENHRSTTVYETHEQFQKVYRSEWQEQAIERVPCPACELTAIRIG